MSPAPIGVSFFHRLAHGVEKWAPFLGCITGIEASCGPWERPGGYTAAIRTPESVWLAVHVVVRWSYGCPFATDEPSQVEKRRPVRARNLFSSPMATYSCVAVHTYPASSAMQELVQRKGAHKNYFGVDLRPDEHDRRAGYEPDLPRASRWIPGRTDCLLCHESDPAARQLRTRSAGRCLRRWSTSWAR
jgi:hypothetical protein